MKIEIKIGDRVAEVELIERRDDFYVISLDGKIMELDAVMVEPNVYSIIHDTESFDMEVQDGDHSKEYLIHSRAENYVAQIIDAEAKYQMARGKASAGEDENAISSPMPGKIVKVLVKPGDEVKAGETVVIVSAMKMESEYKVKQDRKIVEVCVNEGDNIDSHQALVIVE